MESLMNPAIAFVRSLDWQSPLSFLALVAVWLILVGRWGILLLLIATVSLGSVAGNLIILNAETAHQVVGLPFVIYCVGGAAAGIVALIGFVRHMMS
jgi:hypothetical protein